MRIYLIGFMGAGKTVVGKHLARTLGYRFVDLDAEVERRAGMPIREIFAQLGEARFRELETSELRASARADDTVVATGGGTVVSEENRAWIRRHGLSVWLDPSFETIVSRLGPDGQKDRPLFQSIAQARTYYRQRRPAYGSARLRFAVGPDASAAQVANDIAQQLREKSLCDI